LDRRQRLAGPNLVADVYAQRTDWAGKTGADLGNTALNRGKQALHLMLVGNHAGADRLRLDAGLLGDVGRNDRAGDFTRFVMPMVVDLRAVAGSLIRMGVLCRLVRVTTAGRQA